MFVLGLSLRQQLQAALAPSYVIERELEGGGMSRVFVAEETALGRRVVVKVLAPELSEAMSAERFEREVRLAARLQHPNVVPLLAAGNRDGLSYYMMPYVEGQSLRALIARDGRPPLDVALSVLRDVARALEYAHGHGIVHRDVKPDNVLLTGSAAAVADFGIAKALHAAHTAATLERDPVAIQRAGRRDETLTRAGSFLGTPAYMAPEQAAGDPDVDARADLYAWGVVAYELLTGAPPFAGRSVHQLVAAHIGEHPLELDLVAPSVPSSLAALVMRCLEKDPARRPQSARAVLDALDAASTGSMMGADASRPGSGRRRTAILAAGTLAIVAAATLGGWVLRARGAATGVTGTTGPSSIAVLPFENQGDSADAYFADGLTDAVRGKLTALSGSGLTVIPRGTSVSYRGTAKPPAAIASELGVRYLLTGTVRFAGAGAARRVQVSPELVEITAGHAPESRWAQPFDAAIKDVFAVQADIAGRVATAMQIALGSAAQARLAEAPTRDPAAYDAFLRGEAIRNAAQNDPRSVRRAIAAYEEALRHDSTMAPAWAGLSRASAILYSRSTPSPELARTAHSAAERAIALDSTRVDGYLALAHSPLGDLGRMLAAIARARQLAPHDVDVLGSAANVEGGLGQLDAAERDVAEATRLDPRNARTWQRQLFLQLRLGRGANARAAAERQFALTPTSLFASRNRVVVEAAAGDVPAARQVLARATGDVSREALVALVATDFDLGWLLDDDQARLLLTLGADAFDGDRGRWALVRAEQYDWRGDPALARAWGDSAAREFALQLRAVPTDAARHVWRGLALAYAGRGREALAQVERGMALEAPTAVGRESASYGYFAYVAARVALLAGDRERALGWLAAARQAHYYASPAWIRAEPTWAPLRSDPRFAALVAEPPVAH
jgi:serine/threonine-protein kinase